MPESGPAGSNAWLMFRAIGDYDAIGYHCFAVESVPGADGTPTDRGRPIVESFRSVASVLPLLLQYQGTGRVHAVVQEDDLSYQMLDLEGYAGKVEFGPRAWGPPAPAAAPADRARGFVIQAAPREVYLCGGPFRLFLRRRLPPDGALEPGRASIRGLTAIPPRYLSADQGHFDEEGRFVVDHHRNGDDLSGGAWTEAGAGVVRLLLAE